MIAAGFLVGATFSWGEMLKLSRKKVVGLGDAEEGFDEAAGVGIEVIPEEISCRAGGDML